jgi:hypothetical protein
MAPAVPKPSARLMMARALSKGNPMCRQRSQFLFKKLFNVSFGSTLADK